MEGEMCECEGKKMDKQGEGGREGGEQRKQQVREEEREQRALEYL